MPYSMPSDGSNDNDGDMFANHPGLIELGQQVRDETAQRAADYQRDIDRLPARFILDDGERDALEQIGMFPGGTYRIVEPADGIFHVLRLSPTAGAADSTG